MLEQKIASEAEIDAVKDRIKAEMDEAVAFAENSPLPDPSELYTDNYDESDYPYMMD